MRAVGGGAARALLLDVRGGRRRAEVAVALLLREEDPSELVHRLPRDEVPVLAVAVEDRKERRRAKLLRHGRDERVLVGLALAVERAARVRHGAEDDARRRALGSPRALLHDAVLLRRLRHVRRRRQIHAADGLEADVLVREVGRAAAGLAGWHLCGREWCI